MDSNTFHVDNNHDEVVVDNQQKCNEIIGELTVGMRFLFVDEVWVYYIKYGKHKGF